MSKSGIGWLALLVTMVAGLNEPARAMYYSTDSQGTFNTGSAITNSNTFDLSGDGSAYVTISADSTDDITVSAASGYLDASSVDGTLMIQPGVEIPGPTDSFMDATQGPYYINNAMAASQDAVSAFTVGAVQTFAFQFTDQGQTYLGYVQGSLDNNVGFLEFSATDFGSDDPAAGPPAPVSAPAGSGPESAPEPATLSLLALGIVGVGTLRRRRAVGCPA